MYKTALFFALFATLFPNIVNAQPSPGLENCPAFAVGVIKTIEKIKYSLPDVPSTVVADFEQKQSQNKAQRPYEFRNAPHYYLWNLHNSIENARYAILPHTKEQVSYDKNTLVMAISRLQEITKVRIALSEFLVEQEVANKRVYPNYEELKRMGFSVEGLFRGYMLCIEDKM